MSIGDGVYFVRGTFAQVQGETLILDQYTDTPSYRIGFNVQENFISADEDPSLNDNSVNSKFSPIICKHKALESFDRTFLLPLRDLIGWPVPEQVRVPIRRPSAGWE